MNTDVGKAPGTVNVDGCIAADTMAGTMAGAMAHTCQRRGIDKTKASQVD